MKIYFQELSGTNSEEYHFFLIYNLSFRNLHIFKVNNMVIFSIPIFTPYIILDPNQGLMKLMVYNNTTMR